MPTYQYVCNDCFGSNDCDIVDLENDKDGINPSTKSFLFFKVYKMTEKKNSPKCPKCGGYNTSQSFENVVLTCYVRGDGIVKDKGGARRDMNRHHLVNQDPYGHMRQSGEVDHILDQIKNAGLDQSKIISKKAAQSQRAKNIAESVMHRDLNDNEIKLLTIIRSKEENGAEYDDFSDVNDVNKIISDLMYDFICKNGDKFKLMALGRRYMDDLDGLE